ncbi:MAG: BlaI/MecI/CopY family transcriptional regulator [Candidatus Sumerlaeaceae bacterium]
MIGPTRDLSKTEWSIMGICWRQGKCTARQVFEESLQQRHRSYQTIKTMLDRLADKGYLRKEKLGPLWLYQPTISRSKLVARAVENFVETVLDNTVSPLFVHLAQRETLSSAELDELRQLVQQAELRQQ